MNLETNYLGLRLPHPFMSGASPLADDLGTARQLEDAGAAAIVMRSLFEEQIRGDDASAFHHRARYEDSFSEATSFLPPIDAFTFGPDEYLAQIQRLKSALKIPVIASLNGTGIGGWVDYARLIEQAGADALELNLYFVPTDPDESADDVESRTLDVLRVVRSVVKLPLAAKLSPFHSALPNFARRLDAFGANGLVLFNRFFQPDINPERLEAVPRLDLSTAAELRLRLRWLGVLFGTTNCSLACSGGIHRSIDAIKAVMAGADAVQCVSSLLQLGPKHLGEMITEMRDWMERHEFESLAQMKGNMSLRRCPDPSAYQRANYLRTLQLWRP
jgi:dihydroorotate dehydrogenase (fumarate)